MTTWAVWFFAAMIVFACIEGFALFTRRIPTLSATIWQLTKRQPLLPFAIGLVVGVLLFISGGQVGAQPKGAMMKSVMECDGNLLDPFATDHGATDWALSHCDTPWRLRSLRVVPPQKEFFWGKTDGQK